MQTYGGAACSANKLLKGGRKAGKTERVTAVASQQPGTRKSEQRKTCKETQLTICNREPPILLLHLELALSLRRIVLVFVHLFLVFARLHLGFNLRFLRRRGGRHGYEWFRNSMPVLWASNRSAGTTTSDLNWLAGSVPMQSPRFCLGLGGDRIAEYVLRHSNLRQNRASAGWGEFGSNAQELYFATRTQQPD